MSDVPMGPRPAAATTTKEVNQLPQSKKRRSSQKASDESGPDEQKDQPEPESQVQQSNDQPEPEAQAQTSEKDQPEEQSQPEPQAGQPTEDTGQNKPDQQDEPTEQAKEPDEETEQPTVADVLTQREEAVRFHNERAGGGDVHEGELQNQLDSHNERTGDPSR